MAPFIGGLYDHTNVYVRGLADHVHFTNPVGLLLKHGLGAVHGTRTNLHALLQARQDVLVYPGGGHEVLKPSTVPNYTLMWKERLGFARFAIQYGYDIIPISCVGPEDMIDVMWDINLNLLRPGQYLPIPFPILPHKLQRIYFYVGARIFTCHYSSNQQSDGRRPGPEFSTTAKGGHVDTVTARVVRDQTRTAIEEGIKFLQRKQREDPERFVYQRMVRYIASFSFMGGQRRTNKTMTKKSK